VRAALSDVKGTEVPVTSDGRWEPKRREQVGVHKPCDLDHQIALQPQDIEGERPVLGVAWPANIGRDRRLHVRGGRHGPELTLIGRQMGFVASAKTFAISSRPWNHAGYGGIVRRTSSRRSAVSAVTSARSVASKKSSKTVHTGSQIGVLIRPKHDGAKLAHYGSMRDGVLRPKIDWPTTWLFTLPHALPRQGGLDRPEVVQAPAIHLFVALGLLRLILGRYDVEIRAVGIDTRRRRLAVPVIDWSLRHGDSLEHFMGRPN